MKLHLTFLLAAVVGAFASEEPAAAATTPEQLRKGLKARGLQSGDGSDSGADTGGGGGCFSALTTVQVQGKGLINMDSLEIGDYVHDGKDYSRVYSFAHLDRDIEYDYVQIHTEGSADPLEITHNHMIFLGNKAVRAEEVTVGDVLGDKTVTEITQTKSKGLYAPMTFSGAIAVNGIKASTYVAMMDHVPINQHHMVHMFYSAHRAACTFNFAWCEQETYDSHNHSVYTGWALRWYMHCNSFSAPVQWMWTALCAIVFPTWCAMEQFIVSPITSIMVVAFLVYKTKTKKVKSA